MPVTTLPFGEWLPDQPELGNPGATLVYNALPAETSYRPWPSLGAISGPLGAYCRGAIAVKDTAGNTLAYAGDRTKLYRLDSGAWTDASKSGGYSLGAYSSWSMTLWPSVTSGQPLLIAASYDAPIQALAVGEASFDDLLESELTPTARAMCVMTTPPFLMLGGTQDPVYGEKPTRIWWSHMGNPALFDQSQEFQSDFQDLPDSIGFIRALVALGRSVVVLADEALYRATYDGPPEIFGFSEIAGGLGCIAGGSAVKVGGLVYYLSRGGWRVTDGETTKPIGAGKVDRWTMDRLDRLNLHRVSGCYDPGSQCVLWALPGPGNVGGTPNVVMAYNVASQRWSQAEQSLELLFAAATPGYSLDSLDTISTSVDTLPASLDDPMWSGGDRRFGGFDAAHRLAVFGGTAMPAAIETTEAAPGDGQVVTVRSVRPLVDRCYDLSVSVAVRDDLTGDAVYSAPLPAVAGKVDLRVTGRYVRARVNMPGGFSHASGIEVDFATRGRR